MRSALCLLAALVLAGCAGSGSGPSATPVAESTPTTDPPADRLSVETEGWSTDFSRHTVPLSEFHSGGPPKDGIPAIDDPTFVTVEEAAKWLEAREPVIELELGGEARAYPLQILIWHEIVNDTIAGTPVTVTFCPLCNTTIVFDRQLGERTISSFGTTGNLRNSDLVMYDRDTETWWQQFGGEAVVGALAGEKLEQIPARIAAFADFARSHPDGEVLARPTGFSRPYGQNPYTGYDDVDTGPLFSAANEDDRRLHPKERVVFLEREDEAVAVPFSALERRKRVEVSLGGERLIAEWVPGVRSALDGTEIAESREAGSATVVNAAGEPVAFDTPFWFAVAAFRPNARIVGQ